MQGLAKVSEIMTKNVIHVINVDESVVEAAKKMKAVQTGCLIVLLHGEPAGIVTERDLVQRVLAVGLPGTANVSEVMSNPLITIPPEASVSDAAKIMVENRIRRLPVLQGTELVGILTATDFAKYLKSEGESGSMLDVIVRGAEVMSDMLDTDR